MKWYYVDINGKGNGYQNDLETIKNALYELFGDVPIATDDELMSDDVRVYELNSAHTSIMHVDIVEVTN